jgi:hypothetical protein
MTMHVLGGADRETGELVLIGDEADLRRLVGLLRDRRRRHIFLDPVAAEPAIRPITALRLDAADGLTTICVSDDIAIIAGGASSYEDLASEMSCSWNTTTCTNLECTCTSMLVPACSEVEVWS